MCVIPAGSKFAATCPHVPPLTFDFSCPGRGKKSACGITIICINRYSVPSVPGLLVGSNTVEVPHTVPLISFGWAFHDPLFSFYHYLYHYTSPKPRSISPFVKILLSYILYTGQPTLYHIFRTTGWFCSNSTILHLHQC